MRRYRWWSGTVGTYEAARALCCSPHTVHRWVRDGSLRAWRVPRGTSWRFRVSDLISFADAHGMGVLIGAELRGEGPPRTGD